MAETLQTLRRRVRSIANTQQVTRAMEMVSAAKLRRTQAALMAARPYVRHLEALLGRLAPIARASGHPLFAEREVNRATLVLLTADRGLCGSFNSNLFRQAHKHLDARDGVVVDLICIGRRGADYFARAGYAVTARYDGFGGKLDRAKSDQIAQILFDRFAAAETDEVHILYSDFISTAVTRPTLEKFLPIDQSILERLAAETGAPLDYLFDPDRETVVRGLAPNYLRSKIFICLAESFTSEHSARMLAMNNATKNCDELVDALTLRLNKARQSTITGELLDIVGGAEALTKG
jgi:F-type H+-transporting ATPase subunit gamma